MNWSLSWTASLSSALPPSSDAVPTPPAWGSSASVPADTAGAAGDLRVQHAQAGDTGAFTQLYDDCGPAVHALLRAMLPRDQVEDLHQEVFLAAWAALARLDPQADFRPWVYGIARNLVRRHLRKESREARKRDQAANQVPAIEANEEGRRRRERAERVLFQLRKLPAAERELLGLRLIEGMSPSEIAVWTGSSPGSVRVQVHRALARLRALCQEDEA